MEHHLGLEWKFIRLDDACLSYRLGLNKTKLATGLGIMMFGLRLDYAYQPSQATYMGTTHWFSITYALENKPSSKRENDTSTHQETTTDVPGWPEDWRQY